MRYRKDRDNTCRAGCGDLTASPTHLYCGAGGKTCQWLLPEQYADADRDVPAGQEPTDGGEE